MIGWFLGYNTLIDFGCGEFSMIDKRILVTGGAGYIGSHANALLNTLGFKTLVLDNLTLGHREALQNSPLQHISAKNMFQMSSLLLST